MEDVISRLTGTQALHVLGQVADEDSCMAEKVSASAICMLVEVNVYETADEVFAALDFIAVEDCWDRAGSNRDGYTSPEEASYELIAEELEPFADQVISYHDLDMLEQERSYCQGVIIGLYRYETESKSQFRAWSEDLSLDSANRLLNSWRGRNTDKAMHDAMDAFLCERCPKWAKHLVRGNTTVNVSESQRREA